MRNMPTNNFNIQGLTTEQVLESRKKFGYNRAEYKKENRFLSALSKYAKDPMIILLLAASSIYFISGKIIDGIFLASAIAVVSLISSYQDSRSRNALEKLKDFTQPKCKGEFYKLKI
jgi:Ca2+-transporting ATPase